MKRALDRLLRSNVYFCFYAEIPPFSEKTDTVGDASSDVVATAGNVSEEGGEDVADKEDGKLSLRMKLVTPVEEGSSERFSLQSENLFPAKDNECSYYLFTHPTFL